MADIYRKCTSDIRLSATLTRVSFFALILSGVTLSTQDTGLVLDDEDSNILPQRIHNDDLTSTTDVMIDTSKSDLDSSLETSETNIATFGNDAMELLKIPVHRMRHKKRHGGKQRRRRHLHENRHRGHHGGHPRKSCKTKSAFVFHNEAVDIFGNTVTLHPSIHVGGVAIDQYFYETFCDKEACACSGIDKDNYRSACETTHSFTYARVIKQGEIGWTQIMVRSGCSCVIHERKRRHRMVNIMDSI